jgi:group I intron endonuclease
VFIYAIVCDESLKLYIGQHSGKDLKKYLTRKFYDAYRYSERHSHLFAAMRKYPRESWSIYPLISGIEDKKELDETEQFLIYALKSQHPDIGYNICDGGEGRTGPVTEETRRKLSEAHLARYVAGAIHPSLGTKQSQETIAKRIAKTTGQVRTEEQAARIAAGRKGKGMGDRNAQHRDGLSEETKQKIGESNKKGWSPERRQAWSEYKKIHNGMKGRPAHNKGKKATPAQIEASRKQWTPEKRATLAERNRKWNAEHPEVLERINREYTSEKRSASQQKRRKAKC